MAVFPESASRRGSQAKAVELRSAARSPPESRGTRRVRPARKAQVRPAAIGEGAQGTAGVPERRWRIRAIEDSCEADRRVPVAGGMRRNFQPLPSEVPDPSLSGEQRSFVRPGFGGQPVGATWPRMINIGTMLIMPSLLNLVEMAVFPLTWPISPSYGRMTCLIAAYPPKVRIVSGAPNNSMGQVFADLARFVLCSSRGRTATTL